MGKLMPILNNNEDLKGRIDVKLIGKIAKELLLY